jgi:hypothetical protein
MQLVVPSSILWGPLLTQHGVCSLTYVGLACYDGRVSDGDTDTDGDDQEAEPNRLVAQRGSQLSTTRVSIAGQPSPSSRGSTSSPLRKSSGAVPRTSAASSSSTAPTTPLSRVRAPPGHPHYPAFDKKWGALNPSEADYDYDRRPHSEVRLYCTALPLARVDRSSACGRRLFLSVLADSTG